MLIDQKLSVPGLGGSPNGLKFVRVGTVLGGGHKWAKIYLWVRVSKLILDEQMFTEYVFAGHIQIFTFIIKKYSHRVKFLKSCKIVCNCSL